jgi:cytochrome P450
LHSLAIVATSPATLEDQLVRSPGSKRNAGRETAILHRAAATLTSSQGHADDVKLNSACAVLRHLSPVHWVDSPGVRPFWAIMRHGDILSVELRSREFAAGPRTYLASEIAETALQQITGKPQVVRGLTEMDEPDHGAYRSIIQPLFAPAALRALEEWLDGWAAEMVQRIRRSGGVCDFAADISAPFTFRAIARMLGLPGSDDARLLRLTEGFVGAEDPRRGVAEMPIEAMQIAMLGLRDYLEALTIDRRVRPRDDLASRLANAKMQGGHIPHYELISYFILMMTAGHSTTALAISGGMQALLANPDQLARLRQEPTLLDTAIDEMLRWTSPLRHFMRTAVQDTEIGGKRIRAGEAVALFFNSGNRDETVFPNADRFLVDRSPNQHIAFGRGPHFCVGHQLARMEMRALFSELLRRTENVELAGRVRRAHSTFISGVTSLPVRFTFRQGRNRRSPRI